MNYLIDDTTLSSIADAIRNKTGDSAQMEVSNMASEIESIITEPAQMEKTVRHNGTYNASDEPIYGYSKVIVDVEPLPTIYGFHIDANESDPTACITYLESAVGATPAYMDFDNSKWEWGSWENAFFMPRPCMLKSDGTVDYYLDPNDYTKKLDGTASDVADLTYDGNAMMEWGRDGHKIWIKIVPDEGTDTSASIYIANGQVDDNYTAYPFINKNGNYVDHFYTAIYNGSVSDGKMRSISGTNTAENQTATQQRTTAMANNPTGKDIWDMGLKSDIDLINFLLILITKSLDVKTKIGYGMASGSQAAMEAYTLGGLNDKGLFFGYSGNTNVVKAFGMENWWGFQWKRYLGHFLDDNTYKVKLCYGRSDGSETNDYNLTGSGYVSKITAPGEGYVKEMSYSNTMLTKTTGSPASSSNYYKAYFYKNASGLRMACFGGASGNGAYVSPFYVSVHGGPSNTSWVLGSFLSCKPLA